MFICELCEKKSCNILEFLSVTLEKMKQMASPASDQSLSGEQCRSVRNEVYLIQRLSYHSCLCLISQLSCIKNVKCFSIA